MKKPQDGDPRLSFRREHPELAGVVHRNIRALLEVRQSIERGRSPQERFADAVTRFAGSMTSVYLHALFYGGWIAANIGRLPGIRPWDPFPFVMLAMCASVEAIFLSTFVLISQNRMAAISEKRAELDLQINLLAEHEVTRLIRMADALCAHFGLSEPDPSADELKKDVPPEAVLREIEEVESEIAAEEVARRERDGETAGEGGVGAHPAARAAAYEEEAGLPGKLAGEP